MFLKWKGKDIQEIRQFSDDTVAQCRELCLFNRARDRLST
jgi:hypothetical protein